VGHQALRVTLKRRGHRHYRQALLHALEDLQVIVDDEVGLPADQQLHAIDLRATHADGHLQPFFLVQTFGQGLVKAALFSLGVPGGQQHDLIAGHGRRRAHQQHTEPCQQRAKRLSQAKAVFHDCSPPRFEIRRGPWSAPRREARVEKRRNWRKASVHD